MPLDLALYLSSSAYYECNEAQACNNQSFAAKQLLDSDLNLSPASLAGVLLKFSKSNQVYYYMSSRNNNFSNRGQKGFIKVN